MSTITGTPGAGKTSVAKVLAKRLGIKFYSAGDILEKMAAESVARKAQGFVAARNPGEDRAARILFDGRDERLQNQWVPSPNSAQ